MYSKKATEESALTFVFVTFKNQQRILYNDIFCHNKQTAHNTPSLTAL
jgi:hypothetical protein